MTTGRTIVITGASSGIGAAAARAVHEQGWRVVVTGRDPQRLAAVATSVDAEPLVADFAVLDDVRKLADDILACCPRIDVLANNAGGQWSGRPATVDGHSKNFQVNYLAPYLLTRLLQQRLVDSAAAVISTTSTSHRAGRLDPDHPDVRGGHKAYGDAKLANILMTREIDRRWGPQGVRSAAFHPGIVATSFGRDVPFLKFLTSSPVKYVARSPRSGAQTLLWLASTDAWPSGEYFADRKRAQASADAYRDDLARALWDRTAALVGLETT
jgi:NAD(P)-dependent dehydrogenase (short-subunit alcohol dehydrogenase family)